jgi:uncharacterized protein (DUF58 family)
VTTSLLQRVKSKMSIFAHRKARGMLDGEYGSVFKGRSLDFEDLRAYLPGDEVRDIDWKATARHGSPLIRRYVAVRRQTLLLVTDTGRNMAATATDGEDKKDIAVMALGILGYLAHRHRDVVGLVAGDSTGSRSLPAKGGEAHLERLLREVHSRAGLSAPPSNIRVQLEHVARNYRQRMLVFVVADELLPDPGIEGLLRRLRAQHEILWLTIGDADLSGAVPQDTTLQHTVTWEAGPPYDVADSRVLLSHLAGSEAVSRAYELAVAERTAARDGMFRRLGIAEVTAGSSHDVVSGIFKLLERHRHGR